MKNTKDSKKIGENTDQRDDTKIIIEIESQNAPDYHLEGKAEELQELAAEQKCCGCHSASAASKEEDGRTTIREDVYKKKMINRLHRIQGQVRGLEAMLEKDAYCNDILQQSAAVNAAINSFNRELIANHMRHCVANDIREGKDEIIDELVATLQKLMK